MASDEQPDYVPPPVGSNRPDDPAELLGVVGDVSGVQADQAEISALLIDAVKRLADATRGTVEELDEIAGRIAALERAVAARSAEGVGVEDERALREAAHQARWMANSVIERSRGLVQVADGLLKDSRRVYEESGTVRGESRAVSARGRPRPRRAEH
jgi:hypothetical protein